MKSKKLIALATAAVMSVSALGVYAIGSNNTGFTAFAGVTYSDGSSEAKPTGERSAVVNLSNAEIEAQWKAGRIQKFFKAKDGSEDGSEKGLWLYNYDLSNPYYSNQVNTSSPAKGSKDKSDDSSEYSYRAGFWMFRDNILDLNRMKSNACTVYGWAMNGPVSVTNDKDGEAKVLSGDTILYFNDNEEIKFYPVYRSLSDEEVMDNYYANLEAQAKKNESDSRTNHVAARGWSNNAMNNVYYIDNGKIGGVTSMHNVVFDPVKSNSAYSEGDVESIRKAALKKAGITDDSGVLTWVYDVDPHHLNSGYYPENALVNGKNFMARLGLPSGYKTSGFSPIVYYVTHSGVKEITSNLDVGKTDVMFFTKNLGTYVMILTPGKKKYDNPPTADASALPVMLLAAASLSAAGSVVMRRRRELGE